MSALPVSGIIFILTAGGILLGALTRHVLAGAGSDAARNVFNQTSASLALTRGARGFFSARAVMPWLQAAGTIDATSFYDTGDLKHTLERLVDFDRLNAGTDAS